MPIVIIPRPVIIVVMIVMPRPVVLVSPTLPLMMIPFILMVIPFILVSMVALGVMIAAARPGEPGPEKNRDEKNYEKTHQVAFHGRSPASIGPVCSN
jgi:hypothetical protein